MVYDTQLGNLARNLSYATYIAKVCCSVFDCGCSYMRDADSCGAPECSNVELHISGTAFLVKNTYALSNPNVRANRDPKCKNARQNRVAAGERRSGAHEHQHGWGKASDNSTITDVNVASATTMNSRYGTAHRPEVTATLPDKVWTGYSYIYRGYFEAISMKEMRTVGRGSFELVWPVDNQSWNSLRPWAEVSSSTLPKEAVFIKRPYTATIRYWDDTNKHVKSGHKKGHRDD